MYLLLFSIKINITFSVKFIELFDFRVGPNAASTESWAKWAESYIQKDYHSTRRHSPNPYKYGHMIVMRFLFNFSRQLTQYSLVIYFLIIHVVLKKHFFQFFSEKILHNSLKILKNKFWMLLLPYHK